MSTSQRWKVARFRQQIAENELNDLSPEDIADWLDSTPSLKESVEKLARLVVVLNARIASLEEQLGQ